MFRAQKDTNTGYVYDWFKTNEDGTESHFNVPSHMWKAEQDWTQAEIDALFTTETVASVEETSEEDESFL